MKEKILDIKNLCKSFHNLSVLNNLSFELYDGCIYGLVGVNGCGKTTLINCLLDFINYESGKITWCNKAHKNSVYYIPDENVLPDLLTGKEYIQFIVNLYNQKFNKKSYEKLISYFNLETDSERLIEEYSYGMKKKIQVIASVMLNCKALILDEPFRGLDVESVICTKELLKEYSKNGGMVFLTSHDMSMIEQICNYVFIMQKGNIETSGTPKEILKSLNKDSLEDVFKQLIDKNWDNDVKEIFLTK